MYVIKYSLSRGKDLKGLDIYDLKFGIKGMTPFAIS
jgi:hypothetical protein